MKSIYETALENACSEANSFNYKSSCFSTANESFIGTIKDFFRPNLDYDSDKHLGDLTKLLEHIDNAIERVKSRGDLKKETIVLKKNAEIASGDHGFPKNARDVEQAVKRHADFFYEVISALQPSIEYVNVSFTEIMKKKEMALNEANARPTYLLTRIPFPRSLTKYLRDTTSEGGKTFRVSKYFPGISQMSEGKFADDASVKFFIYGAYEDASKVRREAEKNNVIKAFTKDECLSILEQLRESTLKVEKRIQQKETDNQYDKFIKAWNSFCEDVDWENVTPEEYANGYYITKMAQTWEEQVSIPGRNMYFSYFHMASAAIEYVSKSLDAMEKI